MNFFIVGDIHGCYYTFKEVVKNWNPKKEKLIILGDFVNKGKHTFAVIEYLFQLQKKYPNIVIIVKGNNEEIFYNYYRDHFSLASKQKFENYNLSYRNTLNWLENLPHYWENDFVFCSHAGVNLSLNYPILEAQENTLLTNRSPLQNIGKTQFVGHIVKDEIVNDINSNAWYLDTGAGFGKKLTAVKVGKKGKVKKVISSKINKKDQLKIYQ